MTDITYWLSLLEPYRFEAEAALRVLLAMVLSGVIGWERGQKHRPAGFRTHVLVCVGATLVILVSLHLQRQYPGGNFDPQRMGAQVISGIGFLGAGTIIKTGGSMVKGLTTAASLWATSCIGLAVGAGAYALAILAACCTLIVTALFAKLERRLMFQEPARELHFIIHGSYTKLDEVSALLKSLGIQPTGLRVETDSPDWHDEKGLTVYMALEDTGGIPIESVRALLTQVKGITVMYHEMAAG